MPFAHEDDAEDEGDAAEDGVPEEADEAPDPVSQDTAAAASRHTSPAHAMRFAFMQSLPEGSAQVGDARAEALAARHRTPSKSGYL
ncbi:MULTISPECIES: hypothetical protein [unclassified Streptomyces]|uniref:hypothetical protein n=1 Tax=unclassified Streptomyces TaxID=2593676 RepID=UPI002E81956A|nr:hypothetical protein [Streptomyces sp. NBC_00589]WTI39161.1 hypothetical protein OIC96_31410 [Streptomyces sp. NBC_00775]WUB27160.1 hypothetical protein OHA51_18325 [Streptomyces sp. NBC_00589]